jgi:hypothetical protein
MAREPNRPWRTALPALLLAAGCSSTEPPSATLILDRGQEADAFTREPSPTRLTINGISTSGTPSQLASMSWPTEAFDVGDFDTDQTVAFEAIGLDAAGKKVVRGATIFYDLWAIDGVEIPVFMGRTGETSRPSGGMSVARRGGCAAIVAGRFIVHAGGSDALDASGQEASAALFGAYDLGVWSASPAGFELPRVPRTMAVVQGQFALLIDDAGASWFDFASYTSAEATPPDGMSFAEVVGGEVVYGPNAEAYVVGATRANGSATDAVLRIDVDGTLTGIRTGVSRALASSTWVTDRGLVVAAGHAQAAGVEVLADGATVFAALPMPPDETEGAGAVALDDHRLVLAGGRRVGGPAPTRVLDLSCLDACQPSELTEVGPIALAPAHAFVVNDDEVLVFGDDATIADDAPSGMVRLTGLSTTPSLVVVSLREPRVGAVPVSAYGRAVAIVGGVGPDGNAIHGIEIYMPE